MQLAARIMHRCNRRCRLGTHRTARHVFNLLCQSCRVRLSVNPLPLVLRPQRREATAPDTRGPVPGGLGADQRADDGGAGGGQQAASAEGEAVPGGDWQQSLSGAAGIATSGRNCWLEDGV
jgi:hypothetical protein